MKSLRHWNHRVIEHQELDGTPYVAVHEVHYTESGVPEAYTEHAVNLIADDVDSLRWQLNHMLKACEAPTLKESDFEPIA